MGMLYAAAVTAAAAAAAAGGGASEWLVATWACLLHVLLMPRVGIGFPRASVPFIVGDLLHDSILKLCLREALS